MNIKDLQKEAHQNNVEKGFYEDGKGTNIAEKLMLTVSELSEALEADRHNQYTIQDEKDILNEIDKKEYRDAWKYHFELFIKNKFEDEIADAIIRLVDLAEFKGIDLTWHIRNKLDYNKLRPYKHGKSY